MCSRSCVSSCGSLVWLDGAGESPNIQHFSWLFPCCLAEKVTFLTFWLKTLGHDKCLMNMADNFADCGTKRLSFEGRLRLLCVGSGGLIDQCDSEQCAFLGCASSVGLSLAHSSSIQFFFFFFFKDDSICFYPFLQPVSVEDLKTRGLWALMCKVFVSYMAPAGSSLSWARSLGSCPIGDLSN